MKKIIAALSAAAMLCAAAGANAAEETVEISFSVGDSILTINGSPLEVTAPYIVGDGTTLVPVRVITEAFGAEVGWDGDTQSVNLKYPDVDITIQIGSKSAVVNSHTEELPEAPELSGGTTMVPLRFISETFGAEVDYDAGTERITVTKTAAEESAGTVEGVTDSQYIGDSYFGWRIQNPKTFIMQDRSFDGTHTVFADSDGKCTLTIGIDISDEDIDVDTEYNNLRDIMASGTISAAERTPLDDGTVKIHFRGKDKSSTIDALEYVKGSTACYALLTADNGYDGLDEMLSLNGTFEINAPDNYYDLSNVENGYREFKDDDYKITVNIPADWSQLINGVTNEFSFAGTNDDISEINIGIYSKSDTVTAEKLAQHDHDLYEYIGSPDLSKVSEVSNDGGKYSYTVTYQGVGSTNYSVFDAFFENGNYVYNVSAHAKTVDEAKRLVSSVKTEPLDPSDVGTLLRGSDLSSGSTVKTIAGGKMTVPDPWTSLGSGTLMDRRTGGALAISYTPGNGNRLQQETDEFARSLRDDGCKIVKNVSSKRVNDNFYYSFTAERRDDDGNISFTTIYTAALGNKIYMFAYIRSDIYYGGKLDGEAEEMVYSFISD